MELSDSRRQSLLKGLTVRCGITDCPLGSFRVIVKACSGRGECASVCLVNVFETNERGECVVTNSELCFGCTACLAQCADHGVVLVPSNSNETLSIEELLR